MKTEEVKSKTISGVIVLTTRSILIQGVNAVSFLILTILLGPVAIGIFIVTSAIMRIFNLFTDLGLGAALIQKNEEPTVAEYSTAFFLQVALVSVVVLVGFTLSPVVISYLKLNDSTKYLYFSLLGALFISSFKSVPSVIMERRLDFGRQIIPQIVETLVFNAVAIYLSFRGYGVLSFAYAVITSSLAGLPVYYLVQKWRPKIIFETDKIKHLIHFGVLFQGKTVLAVIKDDLLTFVVSGIIGAGGIGYWGWAQRWAYSPFRFIVDSVTKVTFPAYARLQQEKAQLGQVMEKTIFAVTLVLFPILTGIAILAFPATHLIPKYSKWDPALPSLVFLCIQAGLSGVSGILINFLDSHGQVKTTLKLMVLWIILSWTLTIPLTMWVGFTGVSLAALIVSSTLPLTMYLVRKEIPINFLASLKAPTTGVLAMIFIMLLVLRIMPTTWTSVGVAGISGAIIYGVIILIIEKEQLMSIAGKTRHHFNL
jgi:O-antigen/teichoic acid export membrane protein